MATIRAFEERLHDVIATGEVAGFTHLYCGQEAVAVGVCEHLDTEDKIVSTHRGHGHCLAKGCDVQGMMKEIWGSTEGLCKGKGGSMHIADVDKGMLGANGIVGAGAPIAVGAALSNKLDGEGRVAIAFSGDGACNQGTTFEAMNMAVVTNAPCIFVFENNHYSEHTGDDYAVGVVRPSASTGNLYPRVSEVMQTEITNALHREKTVEQALKTLMLEEVFLIFLKKCLEILMTT